MSVVRVLGMDPSLSNWGLACGVLELGSGILQTPRLGVVQTQSEKTKQVRQNSKDLARAAEITQGILQLVEGYQPRLVFVEVPVGSQSARAMASYGICVGILGALRASGVNFIEVTPTEVKLAMTQDKTASKRAMIQAAYDRHPDSLWPMQQTKHGERIIESKAEHMADALGAIYAGIETNQFQQLRPFLGAPTTKETV